MCVCVRIYTCMRILYICVRAYICIYMCKIQDCFVTVLAIVLLNKYQHFRSLKIFIIYKDNFKLITV